MPANKRKKQKQKKDIVINNFYFLVLDFRLFGNLAKGYLCYKMITSQNVSSEAQVKNFFVS